MMKKVIKVMMMDRQGKKPKDQKIQTPKIKRPIIQTPKTKRPKMILQYYYRVFFLFWQI